MKKFNLFTLALAALMAGACSNDDLGVVSDGTSGGGVAIGEKGYISLAINLPTQNNSVRANDVFDDGTPAEYEVKNATLILFTGGTDDDESIYTVNSAYTLNLNMSPEGTPNNQITTTSKITQKILNAYNNEGVGKVKALVVLNNNGLFSVNGENELVIESDPFAGTLAQLNDALKEKNVDNCWKANENGFLMSNAVLADAQGGSVVPSPTAKDMVLVDIPEGKIHSTEIEADQDLAASIYVERAQAKVTVKQDANLTGETTGITGTDGNQTNQLEYTIEGWALDNTNNSSKLVRTVSEFDTWKSYTSTEATGNSYRFIGGSSVGADVKGTYLYRVYWGDDYNYTGTLNGTGLTTIGGDNATITSLNAADGESAGYCFENTTDLDNMIEKNLTRIIVKAEFNEGAPFYTVDGNREVIWPVAGKTANKEAAARLLIDPDFSQLIKKNLNEETVTAGISFSSDDIDITIEEKVGKCSITGIGFTENGKDKLKTEFVSDFATKYEDTYIDVANDAIDLEYYANGEAYYPVYIRHFDNTETPWSADDVEGSVYGSSSQNYLGRYGMLRNNWYEVNITGIKGLGDPNVVEVTDETVDKKESYISVKINVLSWAKRTQDVEL